MIKRINIEKNLEGKTDKTIQHTVRPDGTKTEQTGVFVPSFF